MVDTYPLTLPDLSLGDELGRGANGVVFSAVDRNLQRTVAVKVWNKRGTTRAREEIAKLAKINHPLFVTVHRLEFIEAIPYAVMEYISGTTANSWLKTNPTVGDRCLVWTLYSNALHHLYNLDVIHGDPHTGNILIFPDELGVQKPYRLAADRPDTNIGVKLVDTGSSLLWSSRSEFALRESAILLETGARLFHDQQMLRLLSLTGKEQHTIVLAALDCFCAFVAACADSASADQASTINRIARAVCLAPYFRLDQVFQQLSAREIWGRKHIFRLIGNAVGFDAECFWDDPFDPAVIPLIQKKYDASRSKFVPSSTFAR